MPRQNDVATCRVQVTLDINTERVIGDLASVGIYGTNKSEVAAAIIRSWLWDNQERLRINGILLTPRSAK